MLVVLLAFGAVPAQMRAQAEAAREVSADDCVHDGFRRGRRLGGDLPRRDVRHHARRAHCGPDAPGDAVFDCRWRSLPVWRDAVLSRGDGLCCGGGSDVGSTRKAIVAKSKRGQYFVLPDNGLLTLVEQRDGIEAVHEITNPEWMIGSKLSSTFHGRDIFSPVGAHMARGDDWSKVGPEMPVKDLVRLDWKVATLDERGLEREVIATDGPFGNLVTNVDGNEFLKLGYERGQEVPVRVGDKEMKMKFVKTFSDVPLNQPLLYIDSRGHLGAGGESEQFCSNVWDQAAGDVVYSAGGKVVCWAFISKGSSSIMKCAASHSFRKNVSGGVFLVVVLLLSGMVLAQSYRGSIRGKVSDPGGGLVAGAKIASKNIDTGLTRDGGDQR